ncbi:MAG: carbohydrate ABC transporter permease [Anaerolineae bacterium]|nr:carbohydrate ABC transporter permease [Anaerolineae bacterium]
MNAETTQETIVLDARQRRILLGRRLMRWLYYLLTALIVMLFLFPWLWVFSLGFKTRSEILSPTIVWIWKPTLVNFYEVLIAKGYWRLIINSLIVAVSTVTLCIVIGVPTAYAFSRFPIPGKESWFYMILTFRMAPAVVLALPLYILFARAKLLGTYFAPILAHCTFTLPFVIWLMRSFFDDIPKEIDAAAMTDGYSRAGAFFHAILPLVKSGIVAVALFSIIFSWNEFLYGLILTSDATRPVASQIPSLIRPHGTLWGEVCALATTASLPVAFLIFALQRQLVRGLSFGAVKG